ncbi:agouti signaling protein 1 [Amia ocellicauda]|uniref:agouti signaling protein 1 n=1 Tax=Amia ocellicauda TaxID=2972642 RepID=UPI00346457AD
MSCQSLLCCLLLSLTSVLMVYTHMVIEEQVTMNLSSAPSVPGMKQIDVPSIIIVELPKTVKKNNIKTTDRKQRKNKFIDAPRKPRPSPPANCVPLWGSCKVPGAVCCQPCAFCQCRLFKTVCYCRMGNPRC